MFSTVSSAFPQPWGALAADSVMVALSRSTNGPSVMHNTSSGLSLVAYPVALGWPFVGLRWQFVDPNASVKSSNIKGNGRVKHVKPKDPITMNYHAPHMKAHEKASSKRRRSNKKKNKFVRSKPAKSNDKFPKITFDRKFLDQYTLKDFEKALCKAINLKILPELFDVVDSFSKRRH